MKYLFTNNGETLFETPEVSITFVKNLPSRVTEGHSDYDKAQIALGDFYLTGAAVTEEGANEEKVFTQMYKALKGLSENYNLGVFVKVDDGEWGQLLNSNEIFGLSLSISTEVPDKSLKHLLKFYFM